MSPRETIYQALFALLQGSAGFTTSSRRLRPFADVAAASQPALFMAQEGEEVISPSDNLPPKYVMKVTAYIYANQPDPNLSPDSILNPLVDAVVASLKPSPTQKQTLGGLVDAAQIVGKIEYAGGLLGPQAVAMIPIQIIVAGV